MSEPRKELLFSRPADRSLGAYKAWIRGMAAHLGGSDDLTDAGWEAAWREFWGVGDNESSALSEALTRDFPATETVTSEVIEDDVRDTREEDG